MEKFVGKYMDNNKDWEELKNWESQQESKKYMDFQEFNKKSKKRIDNINRFIIFGMKSVTISCILIGIGVLIIAFVTIFALFYLATPNDVLKSLEELYEGEKFEIVEDFGAKDSNSRGLYILSPKSNKNIQFKMLNTTKERTDNDYSAQRTKYYIEHCKDKKLLEDIKVDESTVTSQGVEFLHYTLFIELNDYDEIEEKTEKAYKLAKYLHSQDSRMFEAIFLDMTTVDVSLITINCDTEKSLEEEIYSVKYEYIQTLYENNKKEELQKIGSNEIDKIWKPKYLQIIVNEKETTGKVLYNLEDKKYQILNISNFFKQLDGVEILKKGIFSQEVKKIKYNNKIYKIKQGQNSGKNKNDIIYTDESIDNIAQKLGLKIIYDYTCKKILLKEG